MLLIHAHGPLPSRLLGYSARHYRSDFSPTPGGSGVAEAGFVVLFSELLPGGLVGIMAVLWRFTAEYLPFLLGAVVSIRAFGSNVLSMKNLRKGEDQQ